jgi:[ribosomal protein S5]-alanine N-acetyltransferase
VIGGQRVAIGPILPVDLKLLFLWSDDVEEALCNEPYRPPNWHNQEAFWLNSGDDLSRCFFAIRKAGHPDIIGFVQISRIDPIHRSAMLGIRIGAQADRGHGFGREALKLAIAYCWDHLNLTRVTLTAFAGNERAVKLYQTEGFEVEGRFRDALFIGGAWVDVVAMALNHSRRRV